MPRFSENERKLIHDKLLVEGERLFTAHGIKKVTIDELVDVVGIAKATFYTFFESKEYLYLDIVQSIQKKVFDELSAVLDSNVYLPAKKRVRQVFDVMLEMLFKYPILSQIDTATTKLIYRKVTKKRLMAFDTQNIDAVHAMHTHGINFSCNIEVASYAFQSIYQSWMYMQDKDEMIQTSVTDILLNGVIDQIVSD